MWKVASENLRFENFLLDCYRSKNFPELKTAFGQNKSILSWFSRFFIITPRKLTKFFFPDHFSVVSGGNKWSKNWRKSCCKQIKVTKVTYCVQSQQCPFWTLFDIFAPQILQICMLFRRFNYWICENNNKAKSRKIAHLVWPRKRSLPGT